MLTIGEEFVDLVSRSHAVISGMGTRSDGAIDLAVGKDDSESRPSGDEGKVA